MDSSRTAADARKRARRLRVAVLGTLVCAAFAIELYLRATIHVAPDAAQYVYARPPLVRLRVSIAQDIPELNARSTLFTTNALGVRGDDLDLTDQQRLRILTLGDATTECLLLADRDAWPHRLQAELAARVNRSVWVGNAATSGELMLDYLVHLQQLVPEFAPALVLVMPGGYEPQTTEGTLPPIDLLSESDLQAYAARLYAAPAEQASQTLRDLGYSYLGYALRARLLPERVNLAPFYLKMRMRRADRPKLHEMADEQDALGVYQANLRALIKTARSLSSHVQLVLLTRPSLWKAQPSVAEIETFWGGYTCSDCVDPEYYSAPTLAADLRQFNRTLMNVCAQTSVPCFDVDAQIPKNLTYFYDDSQLRAAGAQMAARAIARFLLAQRLLQ